MSFKPQFAKFFAYAAVAAFLPVSAHAAEKSTFSAGGMTYEYTTTQQNGRTLISGRTSEGKPFRLLVGETTVTGQFNGQPVTFKLSDLRSNKVAVR